MKRTAASKFLILIIVTILSSFLFFSCKDSSSQVIGDEGTTGNTDNPPQTLTSNISGQVINNVTGSPLEGADVLIFAGTDVQELATDTQGKYATEIQLSSSINIVLVISKSGFITDSTTVYVVAGKDKAIDRFELVPKNTGTIPSGDPVSIFLEDQSSEFIGVKQSGSEETARITFVVQDSAGTPIDLDHTVNVNFKFGAQPGGGEELSPTVVKTNNNGEAIVNLTSGTKAGTVQIIAEIQLANKKITSLPVGISIHGGLPDDAHFSIAPAYVNFAGYNRYGLTDVITAYVGDKYANPVRPNTAVYFTTSGGIIDGSTQTNDLGIGSVNLISSAPRPYHPFFGAGFATIVASTADENSNTILDSIVILFSGIPTISVNPSNFTIPNLGSQAFSYTVQDQNGNPLTGGTTITVTADGDNVKLTGDGSVTLPDTQNPRWTQFGFSVADTDSSDTPRPISIKIFTSGSNGSESLTINGSAH